MADDDDVDVQVGITVEGVAIAWRLREDTLVQCLVQQQEERDSRW